MGSLLNQHLCARRLWVFTVPWEIVHGNGRRRGTSATTSVDQDWLLRRSRVKARLKQKHHENVPCFETMKGYKMFKVGGMDSN